MKYETIESDVLSIAVSLAASEIRLPAWQTNAPAIDRASVEFRDVPGQLALFAVPQCAVFAGWTRHNAAHACRTRA